jgi:predicted O-methyltransferase YrrM
MSRVALVSCPALREAEPQDAGKRTRRCGRTSLGGSGVGPRTCTGHSDQPQNPKIEKAPQLLNVTAYARTVTTTLRTGAIPRQIRGRTVRHWTLRYIHARTRQALYQRAHPDAPWLTPEAIRLLDSMLRPTDIGVEFGSGRSTLWLAERCAHLTSVEHDLAWHAKVSNILAHQRIGHVDYQCHPRDEPDGTSHRSAYAQVAQRLDDESMDFALVDGVYRDYVTMYLMPKIRPGGMLVVDNVNRYLPSPSTSPGSLRLSALPATKEWAQVAVALAGWRWIWTSSGVWDTAIFVKGPNVGRNHVQRRRAED